MAMLNPCQVLMFSPNTIYKPASTKTVTSAQLIGNNQLTYSILKFWNFKTCKWYILIHECFGILGPLDRIYIQSSFGLLFFTEELTFDACIFCPLFTIFSLYVKLITIWLPSTLHQSLLECTASMAQYTLR